MEADSHGLLHTKQIGTSHIFVLKQKICSTQNRRCVVEYNQENENKTIINKGRRKKNNSCGHVRNFLTLPHRAYGIKRFLWTLIRS